MHATQHYNAQQDSVKVSFSYSMWADMIHIQWHHIHQESKQFTKTSNHYKLFILFKNIQTTQNGWRV